MIIMIIYKNDFRGAKCYNKHRNTTQWCSVKEMFVLENVHKTIKTMCVCVCVCVWMYLLMDALESSRNVSSHSLQDDKFRAIVHWL